MDHERTHRRRVESTRSGFIYYDFSVESSIYKVRGVCDSVEFIVSKGGVSVPEHDGLFSIIPVEYKHGRIRDEHSYELQLCGQTICLEEMFHTNILSGVIYYTSSNRRKEIKISEELRTETVSIINKLHDLERDMSILPAKYSSKCKNCAQKDYCMPELEEQSTSYCNSIWRA